MRIENSKDLYVIARWAYSIGEPIIDDAQYNMLHQMIVEKYPDWEYVTRSWSSDPCPIELLKSYNLLDLIRKVVLTDKTESIPSLQTELDVKYELSNLNQTCTLSYKLDGWNVQASYYNGKLIQFQSRGRSTDTAVNLDHMWHYLPQEIPQKGRITVTLEAIVPNEEFIELKEKYGYKSQRGSVSGCFARPDLQHFVKFIAHGIIGDLNPINPFPLLKSWGFEVPTYIVVNNYNEVLEGIETIGDALTHYEYPTDGLVIRGDFMRAIRIGAWKEPILRSYVTGYDESYGSHRIGIKCAIYPVQLANSTQKLVSVTNLKRIIENNLQIGYPIAFRLSSMAIADLDEEATRILQEQWKDNYEEYRRLIENNEEVTESKGSSFYIPIGDQPVNIKQNRFSKFI